MTGGKGNSVKCSREAGGSSQSRSAAGIVETCSRRVDNRNRKTCRFLMVEVQRDVED